MRKDLVFGMAGSGGDGIVSAGDSLLQAAAAEGYHGVMTKSFGSQIRGGESSCRVRISTDPILNPGGNLDVAVALNWEDFIKFGAELPVSGTTVVIYEAATGVKETESPLVGVTPLQVIAVPIAAMAKETAGTERAKNTVVVPLTGRRASGRSWRRRARSWWMPTSAPSTRAGPSPWSTRSRPA